MKEEGKFKVGITGGIGSGKSVVAKIFEILGIPVYNSDIEAKKIITTNKEIKSLYIKLFGEKAFIDGILNRTYVAGKLFNNKKLIEQIQSTLHPLVHEDFNKWSKNQASEIVMNESALLFESGGNKFMNEIIMIAAPEDLRIKRVMQRDGITKEEVLSRIQNQWDDEIKLQNSNYHIISNDKDLVIPQVLKIYNAIKNRQQ